MPTKREPKKELERIIANLKNGLKMHRVTTMVRPLLGLNETNSLKTQIREDLETILKNVEDGKYLIDTAQDILIRVKHSLSLIPGKKSGTLDTVLNNAKKDLENLIEQLSGFFNSPIFDNLKTAREETQAASVNLTTNSGVTNFLERLYTFNEEIHHYTHKDLPQQGKDGNNFGADDLGNSAVAYEGYGKKELSDNQLRQVKQIMDKLMEIASSDKLKESEQAKIGTMFTSCGLFLETSLTVPGGKDKINEILGENPETTLDEIKNHSEGSCITNETLDQIIIDFIQTKCDKKESLMKSKSRSSFFKSRSDSDNEEEKKEDDDDMEMKGMKK